MPLSDARKAALPNQLTVLRLILAGLFFVTLEFYQAGETGTTALLIALVLFVIAALTDAADGYLARKWKVESQFGRIADPFADKILVLGAMVYLAGPRFVTDGQSLSGFLPWMVVVMLARELLVTAIRGVMESGGQQFGAVLWGKLKMILQSIVIPLVLLIMVFDPIKHQWLGLLRDLLVYATVLVTLISGWPYITGAMASMKSNQNNEGAS